MLESYTFDSPIESVEMTELGLTNQNVIVTTESKKRYFVRIPYPHNQGLFDYELELKILNQIKPLGINLDFISLDTKTGVKISPFVDGIKHLDELDLLSTSIKVADDLKKLHQSPLVNKDFDLLSKYNQYKSLNSVHLYPLEQYESIIELYDNYPKRVLCHNDLVNGNVIGVDDRIYLIDYEYASDNHPYFDLLSFITENRIEDERVRHAFFSQYFNHPVTQKEEHDLLVFELIHDLLWCQWAQMQYSQIKDEVYNEIAKEKYYHLQKKATLL